MQNKEYKHTLKAFQGPNLFVSRESPNPAKYEIEIVP
jgi:hypothetical protein